MTIIVVENSIHIVLFLIWFFFLIHAVQRIDDPVLRFAWVGWFILFNIICIPIYIYFQYRYYLRFGQGGLIFKKSNRIKVNKE